METSGIFSCSHGGGAVGSPLVNTYPKSVVIHNRNPISKPENGGGSGRVPASEGGARTLAVESKRSEVLNRLCSQDCVKCYVL